MNLKCDSIDGISPFEPAKDISNQTYMVMNPIRERSNDQDVWLDIFDEGNSQKSIGPDSDGSVSTYSFSRNQMTSLSQIKTDRTVHVNKTKSKRKLYSAYMSSNVVRSSHYTDSR